jgi:hypothetical protein
MPAGDIDAETRSAHISGCSNFCISDLWKSNHQGFCCNDLRPEERLSFRRFWSVLFVGIPPL